MRRRRWPRSSTRRQSPSSTASGPSSAAPSLSIRSSITVSRARRCRASPQLPDADKWALAFRAGSFAYPDSLARQGQTIWDNDPAVRDRVPDLVALSSLSETKLATEIGADKAGPVIAYLRTHPDAVGAKGSSLALVRERLAQSLAAYRAGDRDKAKSLALSAYLDGFEPVEAALSARNATLLAEVEKDMAAYRSAIDRGESADQIEGRVTALNGLFGEVEMALAPDRGSAVSTFVGAATILLREGLEALLIVVAMLAFLKKGDRAEMTRPVHYGWISALVGGVLTWWAATELITISGATRELTEGFGSVFAALVLLFVGIWMHGKAQADEWQRYIREKLGDAVTSGSAWFLFLLAFIAVYREIFETILFYVALAAEGYVGALIAGAVSGAVVLRHRGGDAEVQPAPADREILRLQLRAGRGAGRRPCRQGSRRVAGGGPDRSHADRGSASIDCSACSRRSRALPRNSLTLLILLAGFAWNRRRSAARLAAA